MEKIKKHDLIVSNLNLLFPNAHCELEYKNDFELIIAIILSAQTTDKAVNIVTKDLFCKYKSFNDIYKVSILELANDIKRLGLFNNKAKSIKNVATFMVENDLSIVPNDEKILSNITGLGRKTINVFLSEWYCEPRMAVDTHVYRVSKRLGITKKDDTILETEKKLKKFFKEKEWTDMHHKLIFFGRYLCKALKPECNQCPFNDICKKNSLE